MNRLKKPICDKCEEEQVSFKKLKKIKKDGKKIYLCSSCYIENRKNHRKETIETQGIEEELKEINRQYKREKGYSRKSYEKKVLILGLPKKRKPINLEVENKYIPKRYKKQKQKQKQLQESEIPIKIKGSNIKKNKQKSSSYLTIEESRNILRIFMSRGLSFDEAVEKKKELVKRLSETRKKLRQENKPEEIIISKQQMLQELWNS